MKKHVSLFEEFVEEGVRKSDSGYEFDWMTDLPDDIMSLRFTKYRGRTLKTPDGETTYTYYYAYNLEKSDGSTDLMKAIKTLESTIAPQDLRAFVNKAVMGFDSTFGSTNFSAIVAPESSSLVLKELVSQLEKKSGVAKLFSDSFVKAASTDIRLDVDKVEGMPEKTKKEVMRVYSRVTQPGKPFKIKEIFAKYRSLFRDFLLFNTKNDRELVNSVEGQRVILVDDFKTSGTTIREMIKQLSDAGAQHIAVFVLIKLGE